VIRALIRQGDLGTLADWLGSGAPHVAQLVPEVREVLSDVPAAPPLDSEQARFRLYDAVCTFLTSATATAPLVLILDDLHWADKSSLLLLQFVVREIAAARLLVLGTYRDVEVSRGHPLGEVLPRLRRERTVDRLLLRGLPDAEVHAMLEALRGGEVPEDFARTISRETAGNPFFIKEILRHLLDEGVARREGSQWVGRVEPDEIQLPESVREVIGRRLARLGEACTKVLTLAAVIGQEFGLDVLQRLSEMEQERLLEILEEAVAARVVEEVPRTIARHRFCHTLIRETLYGELRNLERIRLHRRVAEGLEGLYARSPEPHLAELAHHFLEGLPGGDVDKAVAYAARAGDRANAQLAYAEAAILYERALLALELQEPPDERLRCELLVKVGAAQWGAGGFETRRKPLEEAAVLAERLGDADLLARAALMLAGPNVGFHIAIGGSIAFLERALAALGDRDSALRAQVMGRLAGLRTFVGNPKGNDSLARAAIEMARRVGDARALAYVLSATTWTTGGPDDLDDRLARADELIRLAGEARDEWLAAEGHLWRVGCCLEIGDMAAVDREIEGQERSADNARHALLRWLAALNRGACAFLEGRLDECDALMAQTIESDSEMLLTETVRMGLQGFRNLLLEQRGRAHELIPTVCSLAAAFPQIPLWRSALAGYRVAVGETEAARRDLEALAVNDFRDVPRDMMWMYVLCRLCEVVSFLGDAERAGTLYDLLLPYAHRCATVGVAAASRGSVARSLGLLATVLARYDDAERHFEAALQMNTRIRARVWVAHTQHDYARMLVARDRPGDREKATALAAQALATAREVGMKPLEANVMDLQAAAGLGEAASAALAPEGPTTPAAPAVFQRQGDVWAIAYEGQRLRLKDAKGLQYIAHLLRHEGEEFHAADLAAGVEAVPAPEPARSAPEASAIAAGLGDAGEVLDAEARTAYRQRLHDLEAELAEATQWADTGRAAKLGAEIEFLREELSAAYGLGGRGRKAADVGDRARKAVTSRIRESIDRIGREHAALARHLENAIRTGTFCSYRPDRPLRWVV
jgi:tetratricopeptide (TPR) repeat protein